MKRLIALLFLLVMFRAVPAVGASLPGQAPRALAPDIELIGADFGLFDRPAPGKPGFFSSRSVPLRTDQAYGWVLFLRTERPKIRWREEYVLPARPDTWGEPEPLGQRQVSEDGRVAVTEREVELDGGGVFNVWFVAPGDPKGRHVIRVYVEDVLAAEFEFDVVD